MEAGRNRIVEALFGFASMCSMTGTSPPSPQCCLKVRRPGTGEVSFA